MTENKQPVTAHAEKRRQPANGGLRTMSSNDSGTVAGGYLIDVQTGRCVLVSRRTALRIARFLDATARERTKPERLK